MGKSSTLAYRQTRKRKEKKKMKEETSIIVRVGGQWATGRVRCPTSMHPHTHASASSAAMDTEQRRFEDKKSCWLHLQRRKRKRGGREGGGELVGRNINHTVVLEPPSFFHPLRPGAMTGNSPAEAMHRLEFFFFCPIFFLSSLLSNQPDTQRERTTYKETTSHTHAPALDCISKLVGIPYV